MQRLPANKIQLTPAEQAELRSRCAAGAALPTIAAYWHSLFTAHGISIPKGKLPVTAPTELPGEFTIEWHSKALGPDAIAAGKSFRALHERKDREFEDRLRAQGRA